MEKFPCPLGFSNGCRVAFKKVACAVAVHCCLMNGCVALKDFESAFAQKDCCKKLK